jgi:hypothetical protein
VGDTPVAFFLSEEMLEELFGVEYLDRVVKSWTRPGTFERVVDDVAREVQAGRASLHGDGTHTNPYYAEVVKS